MFALLEAAGRKCQLICILRHSTKGQAYIILSSLLPMSPSEPSSLLGSLPRVLESPWSQAHESLILEPYTYTTSKPGKEIRALLIDALNVWLGVPREQLKVIAHATQLLHNASLMVDDIEDDGQLRRGQPAAHKVYGIPQAINSANYVYFLAYKELAELSRLGGSAAKDWDLEITDELLNLHRGQGLEILWRDSLQCPTEEEYIAMVNNSMSVSAMQARH
jgi:geranylgeranyl diphosphate synthase type 3